MGEECLFCGLHQGRIPSATVYENEELYAFRDIHPQAPTHIVLIPKPHITRLSDLTDDTAPLMGRLLVAATRIARSAGLEAGGYRVVVNCGRDGGQTVFHLHAHLLGGRPMRWPPG